MIQKLKLTLLMGTIFAMLAFPKTAGAADTEIACGTGGCSSVGPLFNESGMYPTQNLTRSLKITNNYPETRSFALEVQNYSDSNPSMGDALSVTITDQSTGNVVYGPKSITQWKNDGFGSLGQVDTGKSKTFKFKISFSNVGNNYQDKKLVFDLKVGFETANVSTPVPTILGTTTVWGKPLTKLLGTQTEIPSQVPSTPEVDGLCTGWVYWWLPLVVEALLIGTLLAGSKKQKKSTRSWFTIPIFLAVASQVVHKIVGCNCITNNWCSKYIFINLAILLAYFVLHKTLKRSRKLKFFH